MFNWKQNNVSRDQAFTKLLELMDQQRDSVVSETEKKKENKTTKDDDKKDNNSQDSDSSEEAVEELKEVDNRTLAWSRFDD